MKSIHRFRSICITLVVLLLLSLPTLLLVACGGDGGETTSTGMETTTTGPDETTDTSEEIVAPEGSAVVPQLLELSESQAKGMLSALGLKSKSSPVYKVDEPGGYGWVASQSVVAGTVVPVGTVISLGIATQGVVVPHLAGLSEGDAKDELDAVGLKSAVVYQTTTDSTFWGKVMNNEPAYLTVVAPGSTVTITVGKKPFQMPSTSSTTLIPISIPPVSITAGE